MNKVCFVHSALFVATSTFDKSRKITDIYPARVNIKVGGGEIGYGVCL